MGNLNGVPEERKKTTWYNYRFTLEQKGKVYSNGLNFLEI